MPGIFPRGILSTNAKSKPLSWRTSRGCRVLIANAHTIMHRRGLSLALAADGQSFTRIARLDIPMSFSDSLA